MCSSDLNININSGNQIINVNAINVNIGTRQITLQKNNNNNKDILKDHNNENNDNNENAFLNASLNDDLNTFQINDEINVNNNKTSDGVCIYMFDKINEDGTYWYGVLTYMSYDFPIIGNLIRIPVYTKTMTMHYMG